MSLLERGAVSQHDDRKAGWNGAATNIVEAGSMQNSLGSRQVPCCIGEFSSTPVVTQTEDAVLGTGAERKTFDGQGTR